MAKNPAVQDFNQTVADMAERCRLDTWASFVNEVDVPSDIAVAFMANRPEMLRMIAPRALSADEMKVLLGVLGALMETNIALREHAMELAVLVRQWQGLFKGVQSTADKIESFASFRHGELKGADQEDEE